MSRKATLNPAHDEIVIVRAGAGPREGRRDQRFCDRSGTVGVTWCNFTRCHNRLRDAVDRH
jgi:hypothetical protein